MDPDHLLFSSCIGSGFGYSYESDDRGDSWSVFSSVNSFDGESAFDFDPSNSQVILAGTFASGVYRSTSGVSGAWDRVLDKDVLIDRFVRDKVNRDNVYALAIGPNPGTNPDATLYYSSNGGDSFEARLSTFANDLAPHPFQSGEAVIAGFEDAFALTDYFATKVPLGLSALSGDEVGDTLRYLK